MSYNTIRLWLKTPLFYFHIAGICGLCGLYYLYNLERVPISDRLRFNIVSTHWEKQLAQKLFQDVLDNDDISIYPESTKEHLSVRRVFDRLLPNAGLSDTEWDVRVIENSQEVNAFVLPGGKVFLYTGLLNQCASDDELATVLGHEIAHNIARHGSESISRALLWVPLFVVSSLASGLDPDLVELAIDVGFKYPNSRIQEREADYAGLLIMAESGYDPSAALEWWKKMEDLRNEGTASYLSTHPTHHNRLGQFYAWLVDAGKMKLEGSCSEQEFRSRYYLQRGFCGLRGIGHDFPQMERTSH